MAQAATAEKNATPPPPREPGVKPRYVPPENVSLDSEGFHSSRWFCTLPRGMGLDALGDPGIWKLVQGGAGERRQGFRQLDDLKIIDADMNWCVLAVVAASTETGASIGIAKKIDLPQRNQILPETETHKIAYSGRFYVVLLKRTGLPANSVSYISQAEATNVMHAMNPRAA